MVKLIALTGYSGPGRKSAWDITSGEIAAGLDGGSRLRVMSHVSLAGRSTRRCSEMEVMTINTRVKLEGYLPYQLALHAPNGHSDEVLLLALRGNAPMHRLSKATFGKCQIVDCAQNGGPTTPPVMLAAIAIEHDHKAQASVVIKIRNERGDMCRAIVVTVDHIADVPMDGRLFEQHSLTPHSFMLIAKQYGVALA